MGEEVDGIKLNDSQMDEEVDGIKLNDSQMVKK